MIPVILSGGSGTRLWPLSRKSYPKQFLSFSDNGKSMLQETLLRLEGLSSLQSAYIVGNEEHRFLIAEQLRQLSQQSTESSSTDYQSAKIILEPIARNTAPAVAVAALKAIQSDKDALLLVLSADHMIKDVPTFHQAIAKAEQLARDNYLVTFGINPDKAETGYGYILRDQAIDTVEQSYTIKRFVEKPDHDTAEQYLASGEYYWNSGMFMFKASRYLEELEKYAPNILLQSQQSLDNSQYDADFLRLDKTAFQACPSDSIDYAVMERTDAACVVHLDANWSDVGAWPALWEVLNKDHNGNVTEGDVLLHNTHNAYIHSDHKLVSVVGLDNVIVIETPDAILVTSKQSAQNVKEIVTKLKMNGRKEATQHRKVYRPWGHYDCLDAGDRYQVKRIVVEAGQQLSSQRHHHRAEHWVVVKGTAKVTINEKTFLLTENQSTYIPVGDVHCLENPGKLPLEMIEVQSGSYLGEDDIVRFDDVYGRK